MDRGDDRRRDQRGIGEREEVKAVVDDVELRRPLEDLRHMQALGHLRVDTRVLRPTPGHHTAQTSCRFGVARGEERDFVPPRHESLGQE